MSKVNDSDWFERVRKGDLGLNHYKGLLLETYHHAGMNPQIQAACTMHFKGKPRNIIKKFFQHAISEIGHDLMALSDLQALGVKKEVVINSRPLPSTIAYNAYPMYEMNYGNHLSYLGYLFHLEFMPTQSGSDYIKALKAIGVADNALTFIEEHRTVDEEHNKYMEKYVKELVLTEEDLEDVLYATTVSCHLHKNMLVDAFINGEKVFN